jgi:thiol:disulfide interchange protein DsbA
MMKKVFISLLSVFFINVSDVSAKQFVEGKDYFKLEQPIEHLDNQVLEFFSYKCAYCFRAERSLKILKANTDIEVVKIPVTLGYVELEAMSYASLLLKEFGFGENIHNHLYYVVQAPLDDEKVLFKNLWKLEEVKAFFLKQGISEKRYETAFNKLKTEKAVHQADKRASKFKVSGTPTFIINGKYKVYGFDSSVYFYREMGELLTYLVSLK